MLLSATQNNFQLIPFSRVFPVAATIIILILGAAGAGVPLNDTDIDHKKFLVTWKLF